MKSALFVSGILVLLAACSDVQTTDMTRRSGRGGISSNGDDATKETAQKGSSDQLPGEDSGENAPPPSPPVAKRTSNGSGGATGMIEVNYTATNGQASSYKANVPADAVNGAVYGLHVHVHGDGGGGYVDFPNSELRYGLMGVTVKAPNPNLQWGRAQGVQHAQYLDDLIQNELIKKYNIDLDRIFFSGVSGGAYFLSGNFIPSFSQKYKTGAFLMCGGEAPRVAFVDNTILKTFRIHWQVTVGERADITQSVNASIAAYKTEIDRQSAGDATVDPLKVQTNEFAGAGGHCVFDGVSYTSGIQQMMDAKFKVILPDMVP